jgi:ATP synthase protein I
MPATGCGGARGMTAQHSQQQHGQQQPSQEPGPQPPAPREADGWQILSYMLGGMAFYGGIGWVAGHFTGISVLFPIGMILGIGLSVAMIIFRFTRS